MSFFTGYISSIAVFLILLSFIRILMPHNKYKCYIDLLLGLIIISVVVSPLAGLLQNKSKPLDALLPALNYKINSYEIKNEEYIHQMQNKLILSTYMDELKKQVKSLVEPSTAYSYEDAEFVIGQDKDDFGDVLSVRVLLSEKDADAVRDEVSFIRVDQVKVRLPNQMTPEGAFDTNEEIMRIKNLISGFYNLSADNIYITVRKN